MAKREPSIFIIFGGSGDLARRKLIPAIYNLYLDDRVSDKYLIIGIGRTKFSNKAYRENLLEGVNEFSRSGKVENEKWKEFSKNIIYKDSDVTKPEVYLELKEIIDKKEEEWEAHPQIVSYLSIAPFLIKPIAENLGKAEICKDPDCSRIVVEKPFGNNLESAIELNKLLQGIFEERQIYRIDHYLGKEAVQNILVFRFANVLFEPIWNQKYIEHVQITVAETVGVEDRGGYYDKSGALKDMIQNHLLQLLCFTAMEPPVSFTAEEIRDRKADVLRAVRKYEKEEVFDNTVRGQYDKGWVKGEEEQAYRDEQKVDPKSNTETFAAVKFFIDNWRWNGVPFYVRSGKHLPRKRSSITIQFKNVPHRIFPNQIAENLTPNKIKISIYPEMGITISFQSKKIGLDMKLESSELKFNYTESYENQPPEAYETLLYDVMVGDATLFMRSDETEAAWRIIMPIVNAWKESDDVVFPNYEAGSWGPQANAALIAKDGFAWE